MALKRMSLYLYITVLESESWDNEFDEPNSAHVPTPCTLIDSSAMPTTGERSLPKIIFGFTTLYRREEINGWCGLLKKKKIKPNVFEIELLASYGKPAGKEASLINPYSVGKNRSCKPAYGIG